MKDPETENNAITRAKADLADRDRKINVIKAEENRLQMQRETLESERDRIAAFMEMYEKYTEPTGAGSTEETGEREQTDTRNFRRLVGNTTLNGGPVGTTWVSNSRQRRQPLHRKPKNTPRMTDMIIAALRDAEERGHHGLPPKAMTAFIRQKWWPHLKGDSVSPVAWRMLQNQELRKEGELYALPKS